MNANFFATQVFSVRCTKGTGNLSTVISAQLHATTEKDSATCLEHNLYIANDLSPLDLGHGSRASLLRSHVKLFNILPHVYRRQVFGQEVRRVLRSKHLPHL